MIKKRILVAVLNWGLGHATRSIPIIRALEEANYEPVLASDGEALVLLKKEFPGLRSFVLPSYRISYPKNGRFFKWHFFLKFPGILRTIVSEKRAVERIVRGENIAGIISDNRFGAYSQKVPSAYITHQLKIISGKTAFFSSKMHQLFINKFDQCWVPDRGDKNNLSGKMSHGIKLSVPVKFIGIYSRLKKIPLPKKYDLLVLLSGPEPQRSYLEKILLKELKGHNGRIFIVKGKIEPEFISEKKGGVEICNFLTGKDLEKIINESELIIARSGYSTLMDLAVLEKKAFFIPTPGQFEQEYLAEKIKKSGIAPFCAQNEFHLKKLDQVSSFSGFSENGARRDFRAVFALFEGE